MIMLCDSAWSYFVDYLIVYFVVVYLFIEEPTWLMYFCDLIFLYDRLFVP
jgi:hypothetical protein